VLDVDLPKIPPQGTSGAALLLRKEVSNLVGLEPDCHTVGTIAHELGHAFGLLHPPDCDSHRKDDEDLECQSLSYLGGYRFPLTEFMPDEREKLLRNRAFAAVEPVSPTVQCSR
jgi:astacin (peptidase family M12A)